MKKILKITFYIITLSVVLLYLGIVFLLPAIINNQSVINKAEVLIYKKTGIETTIKGLNLKISPCFNFALNIENVNAKYKNSPVLDIENVFLNYELLHHQLTKISAKTIYIDGDKLKQFSPKTHKKKKGNFELKKIPETNIQGLTYKSEGVNIYAQNISNENGIIKIKADVKTPYLKEVLKIGDSGVLKIEENKLKANRLEIKLGNSQLFINGDLFDKDKNYNFDLKGEKLPLSEIMSALLHFQKSQDPTKKFIENFKDFAGSVKIDLNINKNGIFGKCVANNFSAKAVKFDIPLQTKEIAFDFKGNYIESSSQGNIGPEKFTHKLMVTDLGTENKEVVGTLDTTLTKAFTNVPNLKIKNTAKANIVYKIKSKKINIFYDVELGPRSDLIYNSSYLGLRNYKRKIHAHTLKDGQNLYLKEFKYSYFNSNKENTIVKGDGLFIRINDKFTPQYINCRTNGYAPISVTGSFGEKVRGGEFSGNLKYDYTKDKITGTFDIRNTRYKAFKIENAHVNAKNDIVNITSNGLFKGEKYSAEMNAKNDFSDELLIYNLKMFLDKLILETTPHKHKKPLKMRPEEFTKRVNDSKITINNWEILVNKIQRETIVLENVKLIGSLKNRIFNFEMKELNFADGIIKAKGIYNFANNSSNIIFEAENINSDKAANMMLNLNNQIEGTANAKVNLDAKDMFRQLDIHSDFEIKEGFFPKLGDAEFMMKNSKYKLSEITNYDLSQKDEMKADIKGSFDVHNTELKNVDITSSCPDSAAFLEGKYEIKKQYADLELFWKYSKNSPKGVKIFYVPLSFILKVVFRPENSKDIYKSKFSKVPEINVDEKNTSFYRIKLNGDINNNKIDVVLKEVK